MSDGIPKSSKKHFTHIPKDWGLKKLEELVYQKITYGIVQPGKFDETGIPLIRGVDYMSGWKDMKSFFKVSKQLHTKFKRSTTKRGDVLLSIAGYAGHVSVVPDWIEEANITQTTARISISNDKTSPDFVAQFLRCDEGKLQSRRYIKGSAQEGLNLDDVQQFLVPLPPLPEQKKIASILTSVDDVIETTQKQIDKLQDLKKATMNELLTKGISHTEFKDSELGRIPKSWEVARLGNYSIIKGGKRLPKGSEFSENPTPFPYIRVSDLKNGSVDTNNLRFVSEKVREHIKRYTISEKDLYISIAGSIGIVGTIPSKLDGALLTENAAKIVIKSEAIHYSFLYYLMNSPMVQKQFHQETGTGGGVPKLALFRIEETTFSLPKISEQHRIVNVLQSLDRKLDTLVQKLSQTQSLKKSLMQDLLTGKVRVQVN